MQLQHHGAPGPHTDHQHFQSFIKYTLDTYYRKIGATRTHAHTHTRTHTHIHTHTQTHSANL